MSNLTKIIARYGFALLLSATILIITPRLLPFFRTVPLDIFLCTIVVIACFCGLGPALAATGVFLLSTDYFFIPPLDAFNLGLKDSLRMGVFATTAVLASSLSARLKAAKMAVQRAHDELEIKVDERTADLSRAKTMLEEEVVQRLAAEKEILQISSREQRRLGEDLHDGLSQTLAGIRLLVEDLKGQLRGSDRTFRADVENIENRLSEAISQAEIVSRGLYPVELETSGLMAALQELAEKISVIHRVNCRFQCSSPILVTDSSLANNVYRIAQEAVMNAIKNGKAKLISIRLYRQNDLTVLSVTDNGVGLHGQKPREGMGLKMMAYRARMINARFAIRSRTKGFTRVTCVFQTDILMEEADGN